MQNNAQFSPEKKVYLYTLVHHTFEKINCKILILPHAERFTDAIYVVSDMQDDSEKIWRRMQSTPKQSHTQYGARRVAARGNVGDG